MKNYLLAKNPIQVDWTRYGNLSRKEEEISAIKAQMEAQLTALNTPEDIDSALMLIKNYLFDTDMRCIHMASKESEFSTYFLSTFC